MVKMNIFSGFPVFVTITLVLYLASSADSRVVTRKSDTGVVKTTQDNNKGTSTAAWCIAKPSADPALLYQNIEYSCHQRGVDCRAINPGGLCFQPNDVVSRASYAMNLYYRSAGKKPWNCDFRGTALLVTQDPSFGSCVYPV